MIENTIQFSIFLGLTFITLSSAVGVILLQNIVYSAFLLGLTLIAIAGLFLLLNADFLAAVQVLIYVGAINVLILFGIMLVDKKFLVSFDFFKFQQFLIACVCTLIFFALSKMIREVNWTTNVLEFQSFSSINIIAKQIFTTYLLPFEALSVLLLAALIGAIIIAKNENY